MQHVQCPYCGKSDGNDDKVLNRKIICADYANCEISEEKQCDICGKRYEVVTTYIFSHQELGEW